MEHTSEQQAILERPPEGIIKVAAGAGCGKTSTLVAYGERWRGRGLYLAFNKAIADEARRKFPKSIEPRTAHSFAFRALGVTKRGNVVPKFRHEHLDDYRDALQPVHGMRDGQMRTAVLKTMDNFLIDAGKRLKVEHCPIEDPARSNAIRAIAKPILEQLMHFQRHDRPITHDVYLKSFELLHRIDDAFDYIMVDEAQDLNPVLISIAMKARRPLLVVGDSYQSIYRFRGAVDAMDQFAADPLPLSQSWRFGESVARLANRILSSHSVRPRFRLSGNPAITTQIVRYGGRLSIAPGTAILARTNARLFMSLAPLARPFHLIGGFRDLERQIASAWALRCGRVREVTDQAVARFATWAHLDAAAERGDAEAKRWRMIVEAYGEDLPAILSRLGALHREKEQDAQIIVSTAHKAKGREFDAVLVLDDFPKPSELRAKRFQKPESRTEIDQEINLLYVACTRARKRLFLSEGLYQELI